MRDVADEFVKKKIKMQTYFIFSDIFSPQIVPFMRCEKNTVEPGSPQVTTGTCVLRAG